MSLDDEDLSARIREHATRFAAPDDLRAGIRAQVALADASRGAQSLPPQEPRRRRFGLPWRTAVAGFALGLLCAVVILPVVQRLAQPLDSELVADHVRAMGAGPLVEVASSDRHTVKPWFQGRIDYAPPVFDFEAQGFPLQGGRIERVRGDRVATLAYTRARHMIDLFVWPGDTRSAPVRSVERGFNLLHWSDGSMQYWLVSDLEAAELERFAQLWRAQVAGQ